MEQGAWLAEQFEASRGHLRSVAYRMLGSLPEAEDAVQETWLRLNRSGSESIDNLRGWLTTVTSRICLDMLRARAGHREDPLEATADAQPAEHNTSRFDPEQEILLAESVGIALLVVLQRLNPAERLALVLHDMFDFSFEEIASIVDRSPEAARQLASRARRRVRGSVLDNSPELAQQRETVDSFLSALRAGNVEQLLAVLDPELVVRVDAVSAAAGEAVEVRGAANWAPTAVANARGARYAQAALINGKIGIVVAPRGRLFRVVRFTFRAGRIAEVQVIGDREALNRLDLAVPETGRQA